MSYDPRAVKISKSVKRLAATIINPHQRRQFIKDYVRIEEVAARTRGTRSRSKEE